MKVTVQAYHSDTDTFTVESATETFNILASRLHPYDLLEDDDYPNQLEEPHDFVGESFNLTDK